MIPNSLPPMWASFAQALGNHLWQSTLLAIAAGLLALVLRKNHARARYWLWLAASVKFLIPFTLLIALGSHLASSHGPTVTNTGLYFAVEEIGQPFTPPTIQAIPPAVPMTLFSTLLHLLPMLVTAAWLCGFAVVLCVWYLRWRQISKHARQALPLLDGREVETLRRMERIARIRRPIEIRLSQTSLEPGIFGIVRPVLVWPEGISERLEDAHLKAILAHELRHVRCRDNLAAAVHMLVEAIFWFHPLVWWMGARLVEERERACDEEVLESGSDRKVYAESILKICEFCVGSPLACVSGVTGADLRKRIVRIMSEQFAHRLDFSRKLLLSVAGLLAVTVPIAFGLLHATQTRAASQGQNTATVSPAYEVASIKLNKGGTDSLKTGNGIIRQRLQIGPGTFTGENNSLQELIRAAYRVQDYQILGAPDWFTSELYDVDAKAEKSVVVEMQKLGEDQRELENRRMLQALLENRFKLTLHHETKDLPIYSLVVAQAGKLHEVQGDCGLESTWEPGMPPPPPPCGSIRVSPWVGRMDGLKVPITQLAANLSDFTRRRVLDKTNLVGKYDIDLNWFPDPSEFPPRPAYLPSTYQPDPNSPPLLTAIQQQLGLKLESQKGPVELLVIDHAEKPAEPRSQNTAATALVYEDVSIKPNTSDHGVFRMMFTPDGFSATSVTLQVLIRTAYDVQEEEISGAPSWFASENYDIEAKMDSSVADELSRLSEAQRNIERRRMLRGLLADRFKLTFHRETKELGVYSLVITKDGSRLQQAKPGDTYPNGFKGPDGGSGAGMFRMGTYAGGAGEVAGQGLPIASQERPSLVGLLTEQLGRPVLDKTGLVGDYDFTLKWGPKENGDSIFNAMQEQLGLKLESQEGSVEVVVIDHVERPSGN